MSAQKGQKGIDHSEVDLLHVWHLLKRKGWKIGVLVLLVGVVTYGITWFLPDKYQAVATILPLSSSGGAQSTVIKTAASVSGASRRVASKLASQFGGGETKTFEAILQSKTLAEDVIRHLDLMPKLFPDKWDAKAGEWKQSETPPDIQAGVSKLLKGLDVEQDRKSSTLMIMVQMEDKGIVAPVANEYVEGLQRFLTSNAYTKEKRNRFIIGEQLAKNKIELMSTGKEIADFYDTNRVSAEDASIDVMLQKTDKSYHYLMKHPALEDILQAVDSMSSEIRESDKEAIDISELRGVPESVYLDYLQMKMQVLKQLTSVLSTQYEMAKIDEARTDFGFQVLDKAYAPKGPYSPKRGLIAFAMAFLTLFLSIIYIFVLIHLGMRKNSGVA